jgi:GNAT superfamily N-acetyltransferase
MTHSIRDAALEDAEQIAAFNAAIALETERVELQPSTVLAGVKAVLGCPELGRYYVAQLQDGIYACLLITYEWSDWRNGLVWWIQSAYVTPDKRQQGCFATLYEHVKSESVAAGAIGLRLYVERENTRAQRSYKALGMDETYYRLYEELF